MLQPEYLRISPYALENLLELKDLIKKSTTLSELEDNCSKFIMDLEETGQYVRYLANEIEIKWRYEARRLGIELRLEVSIITCLLSSDQIYRETCFVLFVVEFTKHLRLKFDK